MFIYLYNKVKNCKCRPRWPPKLEKYIIGAKKKLQNPIKVL